MSDDDPNFDLAELESIFSERARWATLCVSIQEIADDNEALIHDLSLFNRKLVIPLLGSLLTLPDYQSQTIRLEILVALAVIFCNGRKKAGVRDAARWFSQIGRSQCVLGEDPAEDIFVSLAQDQSGNYCILEGVWESAGFYTQRVMDAVSSMPDDEAIGPAKKSFRALLTVSDLVCEKAGLRRYQLGSEDSHSALSLKKILKRNALSARVKIAFEELSARGVEKTDLQPFLFDAQMRNYLPQQQIGRSLLDRYPLLSHSDTHVVVALPSALSIAARDYVIERIVENDLEELFDATLAQDYTALFSNTPLLGGSIHAPVRWGHFGSHRVASFSMEVDVGYFISYHLFQASIDVHADGGFKAIYKDRGEITKALQDTIDASVDRIVQLPDFKEGLIIVAGCGWGKGITTGGLEVRQPNWRLQTMSAADLIRLSWLSEMDPKYFWRIQDGLDEISKSGVQIINPNGILNLIGWVRKNEGHFVQHAELPEGEISREHPLIFNPPLNVLRNVRAEADQSYDRHRTTDHSGTSHDVQRVHPNPLFGSESVERLYASMDDVQNGHLTTVYEGTIKLWVSLGAPNIVGRDVQYRLWEMSNEWLHRIGLEIDVYVGAATIRKSLKVHVKFEDPDPSSEAAPKPTAEELAHLCLIHESKESGACNAVFQVGFLGGFAIADNVAERIFVFNVTRAFLHLIGSSDIDSDAEQITSRVVLNTEARSFHLLQAHHFTDFVRDSLPGALVPVDQVDDAAARIGLGWRVIDRNQGNKILGREECTRFLNETVDVLVTEISSKLGLFDRVSTVKRLVSNSEKASAEEEHWKRTSAAVLGLHGRNDGTVDQYVKQIAKFAGAAIASRVLTEIALCVCPLSKGQLISDIELSKLVARAALVVRIGGMSDAIHYNAIAPEIKISALGDILFHDEFGQLVVQPMLSRVVGDRFVADAPLQKRNYDLPDPIVTAREKIDAKFWEIWKNEMGFDLDEARGIIDALEEKGIADRAAIITITRNEYFLSVCSDKVSIRAAENFLKQFSLATRKHWSVPPENFALKDIYPWRFGRRLSYVARPVLEVDENVDPLLVIAPGALRKGFAYIVDGAYNGRLEQAFFQTESMRNTWWGKASEGHTFNANVASQLFDADWEICENITLPEILNRKTESDFGDVDVLAWTPGRDEVLVIECKDLSFARNYSEIAALLADYQGAEVDGEADSLKKHLIRIDVLKDNVDQLQRFTGISKPIVVSCLVCSGVVPMQYAKIAALADTHVGSIEDILGV